MIRLASTLVAALVTTLAASSARASGVLTDGNARLDISSAGPAGLSSPWDSNFTGPTALYTDGQNFSRDFLSQLGLYAKSEGLNGGLIAANDSGRMSETYAGNTGTFVLPASGTPAGRGDGIGSQSGRFSTSVTVKLTDGAAANQALVSTSVTFTNRNTGATHWRFYIQLDAAIPPDDSNEVWGVTSLPATGAVAGRATQGSEYVDFYAPGAAHYSIDTGSTFNNNVFNVATSTGVGNGFTTTDLNDSVIAQPSTNGAAAFEWDLGTLAPGASSTLYFAFAANMTAVPEPTTIVALGGLSLALGRRRRA